MKTALFLFSLLAPLTFAQVSDAVPATVEGQVVSATTGQPLRKATVQLIPHGEPLVVAGTALSDETGTFTIDHIAPGNYRLSVSRTGYLGQDLFNARNRIINLIGGQRVRDIVIKLTPQGVIAGSVLDEDGDPIPTLAVNLYRERQNRLAPSESAYADSEGHFVFTGVARGRYYVAAEPVQMSMQIARHLSREPKENYVLTYYPDSLDTATAVAVDILPGSEFRSADIRMRKARTYRIAGKIINRPTNSQGLILSLVRMDGQVIGPLNLIRQDSFEFTNILPGAYVIRGSGARTYDERTGESQPVPLFCRFPVTVRDQDIADVSLELRPGVQLSGTARVEDGRSLEQKPLIDFAATEGSGDRRIRTGGDGTFELTNVNPDQYRIIVSQLAKEAYVKSIRVGGQEISAAGLLDLTGGDPGLIEILLSSKAAEVHGTVRDDKGEPVPSASVELWSKGDRPLIYGITDLNGAFQLGSIPPGDYFMAASEVGGLSDAEGRAASEAHAQQVTIREGSHETVDITLQP